MNQILVLYTARRFFKYLRPYEEDPQDRLYATAVNSVAGVKGDLSGYHDLLCTLSVCTEHD